MVTDPEKKRRRLEARARKFQAAAQQLFDEFPELDRDADVQTLTGKQARRFEEILRGGH